MTGSRLVLLPCRMPYRRWPTVWLPVGHGRLVMIVVWWRNRALAIYIGKERP